jgi:hypothetical protein
MALKFAVNNSLSAITSLPSGISGGALNLISTQTASASASLEFSLDDSYDSYIFKFINIHPQTNLAEFQFNLSTDGGSNYNVTKTTTFFRAYHYETSGEGIGYVGGKDLAQSTSDQLFTDDGISSDNDSCLVGSLTLYNPSSSVFVKHFISNNNFMTDNGGYLTMNTNVAGYGNTVNPIDAVKFQMSSGNIDDGIIKMYGVA